MQKQVSSKPFNFKQFAIAQDQCTMKVGTDGVLLGAWADVQQTQSVLDIGTGTGVIAIMLAQRVPSATIHAVEIDEPAFEQAQQNMQASPWAAQLSVFLAPIQDYAKACEQQYDLIVSNPPFFTGGTFSADQNKNFVRHTVKLPHGDLLQAARKLLKPDGRFCVILPLLEGLRFVEFAKSYNLHCTKMTEVHPNHSKGIERLLLTFELQNKALEKDTLVIQLQKRNEFTEEYIALTKDFYVNL